jgi:beta-galactosidase
MNADRLPAFPYGAVYFRKSNPPAADWARDYATAAADGMTAFRHWFLWSAIEVAPGEYDWTDYDRQLDLAAEHGIATIIAEMLTAAPEWAWRRYAHARYQDATGKPAVSAMSASCVTGGFPGLCLDNPDVLALAERFLVTLAERYRAHPGLGAYDVWNECNIPRSYCYCPATVQRFREWLQAKYGPEVRAVGRAWFRHSFATWEDVDAPRSLGPYPDALDWLQFRIDNAYRLLRWRVQAIRRVDPDHPITAHGVAQTLTDHATGANDEWRAAAEVDSYGFTWIAARRGDEPWKHFHAVDLVRAACTRPAISLDAAGSPGSEVPASEPSTRNQEPGTSNSRGKPFWHSEAQAGPLWMQPQVVGRPRDDGRIPTPEDIRFWNQASFAGGATGWFCPRWRPLLDGPLFGAFGMYGLDGARTSRSAQTSRLARWANAPEQAALWRARPVRGEVGIVFAPESNLFNALQQGSTTWHAEATRGAYQGFFDLNVQPDWVYAEDVLPDGGPPAPYRLLYLPYPVHLRADTIRRLRGWVEQGGWLVCEGCPGYFGDAGRAGTAQPNLGLDEVFGAREQYVEFTPDISDDLTFSMQGVEQPISGALFLQAYSPADGTVAGAFAEGYSVAGGLPAVVDHAFGQGRTRLVGTFPGVARHRAVLPLERHGTPSGSTFTTHRLAAVTGRSSEERLAASRAYFGALLAWAGIMPHLRTDNPAVIARLHHHPATGAVVLWALNPTRRAQTATLTLAKPWNAAGGGYLFWGTSAPVVRDSQTVEVTVAPRDAVVARLGDLPGPAR